MIIFILPKNSGLEICSELAKEYTGKSIRVRGEDVPLIVSSLNKQGKNAIGITGEDLFKEFTLRNKNSQIKVIKRISWEDKNSLYGKPALCLMGTDKSDFTNLPKTLKIVINSKYKELAKKYCTNLLECKGYRLEKIYASGATEEFFSNGIVDLVIDIVYSGKSAKEAGLKVYDKIFESDLVILGGINEI